MKDGREANKQTIIVIQVWNDGSLDFFLSFLSFFAYEMHDNTISMKPFKK
jgi:hypothetical protein